MLIERLTLLTEYIERRLAALGIGAGLVDFGFQHRRVYRKQPITAGAKSQ